MKRSEEGRQSRRRGSRRSSDPLSPPSRKDKCAERLRKDISSESLDSTSSGKSIASIASATSTASAVSFEASASLYFEELSSMVDLDNPDDLDIPSAASHQVVDDLALDLSADLVLTHVQNRLLEKHIKNGRLISAVSTTCVDAVRPSAGGGCRDQLSGRTNQRRICTTLSFANKKAGFGTSESKMETSIRGNESFSGTETHPKTETGKSLRHRCWTRPPPSQLLESKNT